jgi:nucleobase:cation symporter-1, NCS1 family
VRGLLGLICAAALWQIAYAPYVSDYSRYTPHDTGARPAFWASYWGCTLGSFLPMVLGAAVGLAAPRGNLIGPRPVDGRHRTLIALALFTLSLIGALLSKESFLVNYEQIILLLLDVLVPWTAINLVDYYALGILVQLPFIASPLYTGPVARAMGGIALSWIIGLAVTSPAYYWLAKRSEARARMPAASNAPG